MKRRIKVIWSFGILISFMVQVHLAKAQGQELQQLLLNIEKLTQLKSILTDMKTGYQIYQKGYSTISSLSQGNFNLHDVYLNGLLQINPAVKNYGRVAEIMSQQASLLSEYKKAYSKFRQSGSFSGGELDYMGKVYSQLVKQSLDNINELTNILTASKLRMSDDERIRAIDRIYASSTDKLQFLRYFNRNGILLSLQRTKETGDAISLKKLYGIDH
ncbi:TerB family tellurite resistance protein [Mucilaginibacter pallidiroseus]|uniref:TerB family tellurite resistance protein n=1 Tax=Mucilaginibacter pallidiroseus TaxID=2599295 RepID=A0A563TZJ0_9SPHI|nr:TerB family tellurite resistance protein [Mucilaginibacter pallidiroseus]TWR24777.1 TerB family tellurite resistance protein [Mucilaginibacter pallidiroseus]